MAEPMDTGSAPLVTFRATDIRLRTCPDAWAAQERERQGLPPLATDADVLLMAGIDDLLSPETDADPSISEPSDVPEAVPAAQLSWAEIVDEELGPAGAPNVDSSAAAVAPEASGRKTKSFGCMACPRAFGEAKRLFAH